MENKKTWLVYLLVPPEMGSEGWSGWSYYCIAKGNTDEEIYHDWVNNVKKIYDVDLSEDLCQNSSGTWSCYYLLAKNELPTSVYGVSEPLKIEKCYQRR